LEICKGIVLREAEQDSVWASIADIDYADSVDRGDTTRQHLDEVIEIAAVVSIQNIEREADVDMLCDHVLSQRRIQLFFCHRSFRVTHG